MSKVSKEECENEAKKIIKSFIENELPNKKISDLIEYSFWNIKDNLTYGNGKSYPDGDCTRIVYAIDYVLYQHLPSFSIPGYQIGNEKINYTGETINTFNTLFSKDLKVRAKIKDLFGKGWEKVEQFYSLYQTIGNFMVLPSMTLPNSRISLNTFKGVYNKNVFDYIDVFLNDLRDCLSTDDLQTNNKDFIRLKSLIKENSMYFSKQKKFDNFVQDFYLSEFENLQFKDIHYYWWYNNKSIFSNRKLFTSYKEFSLDYIEKASVHIKLRSEELIEKLDRIISKKE